MLNRAMNIDNGIAQSYLIGQLAKADGEPEGMAPILIDIAISILNKAKGIIGCRVVRLDFEDPLKSLYEENGFKFIGKNKTNSLNQMVRSL